MKSKHSSEYHKRAEHCSQQTHLTKDAHLKKYWDELAAEWLVLEDAHADLPKAISARYAIMWSILEVNP